MKISVVIPAFNEEENIARLLKSLRKQTFPKDQYEVIVVDNNSIDQTAEIAKKFSVKVVFESRQGITFARDSGARLAKYDIIACTDADCIVPKNFLTRIAETFRKNKDIAAYCGFVYFPDAPLFVKFMVVALRTYLHLSCKFFSTIQFCSAANFSYRKDIFLRIGGYDLTSPLLKNGINADGDEGALVDKIIQNKGKVIFDKNFIVTSSGRRYKNRLLYWFFVEYIIGFVLNGYLYRLLGKIIVVPSYYKRKIPTFFENILLSACFAVVFIFMPILFLFPTFPINHQPIDNEVVRDSITTYRKYEKILISKVITPIKMTVTSGDLNFLRINN